MGYAAVLLLIAAITALALYEYRVLLNDAVEVRQQSQRTALAQQWDDHTRLNITRVMAIAKSGNTPAVEGFFNPLITQTTQQINELQKTLEEQVIDQESTALLQRIAQLRTDYINNRRDFFALLATGDLLATENFLQTRLMPSADAYMAGQAQFVALQERLTAGVLTAAEQDAEMAVLLNLGLAVVALVMSILISLSLTRSITTPLRSAIAFADKIAHGDLTHRMQIQRGDEIGDLIKSLNEMQSALLRVIGEIRHAGDGINLAASEIAMGNQDLSSRTEQSASSLEETASSMEQLTATVRQSADSARQANQLASGAAEVAARGGAVVGQVVHTMNDINQSSQRISDIISVIDGIAFQTNILALNAAVEAARAGEQGRGFAVVAGEVRTLAQRSAQAAKEIKELISASVGRVQDGSRLVEEAGTTMAEIVSSVQRVTDIIGEISAAASEQSDGISQVNVAISQLDQMTQQNAALVEQSAAAAQSMRDQTQRLTQAIAAFRTGDQAPSPVTTSAPPPRPVAKAIPKAPAAVRPPMARAAPGPLPAPRPHPAAQAKAIPPNRAASQPAAAAAAAPRKVLPKAAPSPAPKPADNVEGDWESF
jgi:methyl-accepting chemotaxis protein